MSYSMTCSMTCSMTATCIGPKILLASPLMDWLVERCAQQGVQLRCYDVNEVCEQGQWGLLLKQDPNVILWNVKVPSAFVLRGGPNVLWMDNALISQKCGVFVDTRGLFAESNLSCVRTSSSRWVAGFYARREFGWEAFSEGDADGYVLVCLQRPMDSSVTWGFLPGDKGKDRVAAFLAMVKRYLPWAADQVMVRQHPKEDRKVFPDEAWDPRWRWDECSRFAESVKGARAVVTINSTCAHEALLAGVPVATLGTGTFTGWGVTLECAGQPERLADLDGWRPDPSLCLNYVNQAMTRHFLPYTIDKHDERLQCGEFHDWLQACRY